MPRAPSTHIWMERMSSKIPVIRSSAVIPFSLRRRYRHGALIIIRHASVHATSSAAQVARRDVPFVSPIITSVVNAEGPAIMGVAMGTINGSSSVVEGSAC